MSWGIGELLELSHGSSIRRGFARVGRLNINSIVTAISFYFVHVCVLGIVNDCTCLIISNSKRHMVLLKCRNIPKSYMFGCSFRVELNKVVSKEVQAKNPSLLTFVSHDFDSACTIVILDPIIFWNREHLTKFEIEIDVLVIVESCLVTVEFKQLSWNRYILNTSFAQQ